MAHTAAAARSIALITARAARAHDADLPLLEAALGARGLHAVIVDWDDVEVDWSQFKLVLLRSTWDYSARLGEFLSWLARTAPLTKIFNPPDVIRWNLDKHYLTELHRSGVRTVPTAYAEPGEDAPRVLEGFLKEHAATELVLQPAVGSGARDAQRHARSATLEMNAHMARLIVEGRSVMIQPYLERVDEQGETADDHDPHGDGEVAEEALEGGGPQRQPMGRIEGLGCGRAKAEVGKPHPAEPGHRAQQVQKNQESACEWRHVEPPYPFSNRSSARRSMCSQARTPSWWFMRWK